MIARRWKIRLGTGLALVAFGVAACGGEVDQATADAMSEAQPDEMDHSQHMSGAPTTREPVLLTVEQERALGVVYGSVGTMDLERTIRTVGRIEASEDRIADVTPKVDGFVEELFVGTTGEAVRAGAPLLTLYSPDLVATQEELLTAMRLAERVDPSAQEASESARAMLAAAERRLSYWDITSDQIDRLKETGEVSRTLTLVSPVSGIVLEKRVNAGQRVQPGELLYRVADLSEVWVEGDVFEQDLQLIGLGSQAHIEVSAYPGEHRMGRVSFVYPTVDVGSRTNRVRVTMPNGDLALKPGMFATIFFDTSIGEGVIAVPLEAVIVTGERNLVFVRDGDGMLQPREVVLGSHAADYVEILAGLEPGEVIVQSANFLVDAESRLATTGGGMPGMQHAGHGSVIEPENGQPAARPMAPSHEDHLMEPDTAGGMTGHEGHDMPPDTSSSGHEGHDMPPDTTDHSGHGSHGATS
jgi:Cu(I)/Ag(I) efflux system membrane fusion protein